MAKALVSVCIFCFLCATHSPCASHADVGADVRIPPYKDDDGGGGGGGEDGGGGNDTQDVASLSRLFRLYGDGRHVSVEGFQRIIQQLELTDAVANRIDAIQQHHHHSPHLASCHNRRELYEEVKNMLAQSTSIGDNTTAVCDALFASAIIGGRCAATTTSTDGDDDDDDNARTYHAWLYSTLAIIIVSACGIFGLLVIPVMQRRFYQPLLQFLVALAVGTLAGDALLHLLPHAMMSASDQHHRHHDADAPDHRRHHDENMWKGVVAMLGLILFFFVERFIMLVAKWRKRRQQQAKLPTRLKVIKPEASSTQLTNAADKQCMHKYSSFPYCYDEIRKELDEPTAKCAPTQQHHHHNHRRASIGGEEVEKNQNHTECPDESSKASCTEVNRMLPEGAAPQLPGDADSVEYTVILREHESRHHGHSHTHGHVHAPPKDIAAVAWMVIMGDGLHNFTDGMAIGAAFASGAAGGCSTAVAVFCHELPHELGDFAMLLKAGMSMRQALYYNLLSSVLCLLGNVVGLWLGHTEAASAWIFAAAAGMFLYIALVDMIPELSSGHEDEGNCLQCVLHLLGLLLGFGIMALIAMYEHDLKSIFHET